MNKISKNQSGFTVVETLLVLIVLAVIGFGGYFVWHAHHDKNKTAGSVTTSKSTAFSTTAVSNLLTNFYNQYTAAVNSTVNANASTQAKKVVEQYGSTNLVNYAYPSTGSYAESPITCSQDLPAATSVSDISSTLTSASAIVNEKFSSSSASVKATLVDQAGSLKIDSLTCDPALMSSRSSN